jgi:MoxR-like ATPase
LTEKVKEKTTFSLLRQEINKVIIGQEYMIDRLLIRLLGNGHVLWKVFGFGKNSGDKNSG